MHTAAPPDADVVVGVGRDSAGDVLFDPTDPCDVVAEVASLLDSSGSRVVAVVGASGGCGATTLALHLAAVSSTRACVVDLHPQLSCAIRLGLSSDDMPDPPRPIPVPGGFDLVWSDPTCAERTAELRRRHHRLIIDAPGEVLPSLAACLDAIVLVVTPTVGSARSAAGLLGMVGDVDVAVVANRLGPGGETTRAELQRILGTRVTLELPCSPGLRDSEDDSRLLTSPWSLWLRRVTRLARALGI